MELKVTLINVCETIRIVAMTDAEIVFSAYTIPAFSVKLVASLQMKVLEIYWY